MGPKVCVNHSLPGPSTNKKKEQDPPYRMLTKMTNSFSMLNSILLLRQRKLPFCSEMVIGGAQAPLRMGKHVSTDACRHMCLRLPYLAGGGGADRGAQRGSAGAAALQAEQLCGGLRGGRPVGGGRDPFRQHQQSALGGWLRSWRLGSIWPLAPGQHCFLTSQGLWAALLFSGVVLGAWGTSFWVSQKLTWGKMHGSKFQPSQMEEFFDIIPRFYSEKSNEN